MNLASLSIKRPIFISCLVILMLAVGYLSLKRLPVDMFPNVTFPYVMVQTVYPGAGPEEIEIQVSKIIEDEFGTLPGIKSIRSKNKEGVSVVSVEFTLGTDVKYAEQQVRDRVSGAKRKLPDSIDEPIIRRLDPSDQPITILSLVAELPEAKMFDLANDVIKPKIEQVDQVGSVAIHGIRKREIRVELDRGKLKSYEVSATQVAARLQAAGMNIPSGKVDEGGKETVFRTLGEFKSIKDIEKTVVNFIGNDVPATVADVGRVVDSLEDEKSRSFFNGRKTAVIIVYKQSGANTIAVIDSIKKRIAALNESLKDKPGAPQLGMVRDGSKMIRANVDDVTESILIGIVLTILVVFFFLGNAKSTFITGLALPNSLIGAFILMAVAGFTVNVMSLLALSLAVGLLIDDAIVVRENIFRHNEMGKPPVQGAIEGTREVMLAVVATTLTVVAVFGSIGFLQGMVGQFFKEFGLTICFAMMISLFDALTMAPMLSAYFVGSVQETKATRGVRHYTIGWMLDAFGRFQEWLDDVYEKVLKFTLRRPLVVLGAALLMFVASMASFMGVTKTFMPAVDNGEFMVSVELQPGASIDATHELASRVDDVIRANKEVKQSVMMIGMGGEPYIASFFVELVGRKDRKINTSAMKAQLREQLKPFAYAKPAVKDIDIIAGGMRPFMLNISGSDLGEIEKYATMVFERLKKHPGLTDPDISHKPGKPEFQIQIENKRAEALGVSIPAVGHELRAQVEGVTPAVYREHGREYDIRVRMREAERNLKQSFGQIFVPNINYTLVRLGDVSKPVKATGPASIDRQDKAKVISISADLAPKGPGLGGVITDIHKMFKNDVKLPEGMGYSFVGQADSFKELNENIKLAGILGILFVFLVLASLYESFIIPFTIMLVLPLAICGAFLALFVTRSTLDMFSMIGCIMLLGVATKNSILLVDYTNQMVAAGMDRASAILKAGRTRLRPILMTTGALVAGMLPVAVGLNEASSMRSSMGIAVIGGLLSSTLLSLIVVPAAYSYVDRFRLWSGKLVARLVGYKGTGEERKGARVEHKVDAPRMDS